MIASVGCSILGSSTLSILTSRLPCHVSAFIACSLSRSTASVGASPRDALSNRGGWSPFGRHGARTGGASALDDVHGPVERLRPERRAHDDLQLDRLALRGRRERDRVAQATVLQLVGRR